MASKPRQANGFADFQAPTAAVADTLPRSRYAGLPPEQAADLMVSDHAVRVPLATTTRKEQRAILTRVLTDLAQKGLDVANVTTTDLAVYRAYLANLVENGSLKTGYAANLVSVWNAQMGVLFGDDKRPGEALRMKGFPQPPKQIDPLTMDDYEAMLAQLPNRHFVQELYRGAMRTYIEVAICTAGRSKSILSEESTFAQINWQEGTLRFPDVKNNEQGHSAVLTERCLDRLRAWRTELIAAGKWQGEETPLMQGRDGPITYQTVREALKGLAALAGIKKPVGTHVIRKSTGTAMAQENPRLAREQLGISQKIFERHYNQPTIQNRLARRDIIPGASATSRSTEEAAGALVLRLRRGLISQQEFDREIGRLELQDAGRLPRAGLDPSFA